MLEHSTRQILIRNAGSSRAAEIATRYAGEGWIVSLEISEEDTPGNELVVQVWDAGGHVHVLSKAVCPVRDGRRFGRGEKKFDLVVDAGATEAACGRRKPLAG
ncbi:MAG TPA: hypothetical protein VF633_03795 [Brevundimonas sp.]|jgi:hypothetical protein